MPFRKPQKPGPRDIIDLVEYCHFVISSLIETILYHLLSLPQTMEKYMIRAGAMFFKFTNVSAQAQPLLNKPNSSFYVYFFS